MGVFYQVVDPLLAGEDHGGVAAVAVDKANRPDAKEIVKELRRETSVM